MASSTVSVGVGGAPAAGSGPGAGSGGFAGSVSSGGAGGIAGAGGATAQGGATGTGGSAGTGTGGGGPRDGGTNDASSVDASANCSALRADVTRKLAAAQVCLGIDAGASVCQTLVEGLCCHVPVASKDSEATKDYLDALDDFNQNKCPVACLAIPCPVGPATCKPNANGSTPSFSCQY